MVPPSRHAPPRRSLPPLCPHMDSSRGAASVPARRDKLYAKMARDLDERGAARRFLKGGETSQSLYALGPLRRRAFPTLPDVLPTLVVTASLKCIWVLLDKPLIRRCARTCSTWTRSSLQTISDIEGCEGSISSSFQSRYILQYFECCYIEMCPVIWFQNMSMYHFSMFHASHHLEPIVATENEIEAEVESVKRVTETVCPLRITLDRVVLTSTSVLLDLWQYDPVLLHTSFARILGHPKLPKEQRASSFDHVKFLHELVAQVNGKICGFQATVSELWYVEEYNVLELALDGKMKVRRLRLSCKDDQDNVRS